MLELDDIRHERLRPIQRREYDQLVDLGMFEGERLELLRGMLVNMSPESWEHAEIAHWLFKRLVRALNDDSFECRLAAPFAVSEDSEPEPDVFVGTAQPGRRAHPSEALLVVEVSASSIRKDRRIKLPMYAEAGVPEYWIIDISVERKITVEVYTRPSQGGYANVAMRRDGDILRPLHVPIEIAIVDLPR